MPPKNVIENAEKSLIRARLSRDRALKSIKDIHIFAIQAQDNPEQLALLSARMRLLDKAMNLFNEKQSDVIDALVDLERGPDFEKEDSPLTDQMELWYFDILHLSSQVSASPSSVIKQETVHFGQSLPKIELPQFDGGIVNWRSFRDTFMSLVHDNRNVGDIERFHYLLSCLSGPALSVVKVLPITAPNYIIAWKALTDRYENQRLLATAHVDQLFAFKPILNESLSALSVFMNVFNENIAALKALGVTDLAGFLLFYIGSRVLDSNTRELFENSAPPDKMPDFDDLMSFVQRRCKILENFKGNNSAKSTPNTKKPFIRSPKVTLTTTTIKSPRKCCPFCNDQSHPLYRCATFKKATVDKRKEFVSTKKLCFSCLSPSHSVHACSSKMLCFTCGKRHHTLLHKNLDSSPLSTSMSPSPTEDHQVQTSNVQTKFVGLSCSTTTVVLGTILIHVLDRCGLPHPVRALLDSGSQVSVITSECVSRLNLPRRRCNTEIVGLSQNPVTKVKGKTNLTFTPHHSPSPAITSDNIIILPHITGQMPSNCLPSSVVKHYQHLLLADPNFNSPAQIDMLIGGDLFPHITQSRGEAIHHPGYPSAVETTLGWVIIGPLDTSCSASLTSLTVTSTPPIDELIRQFWTIEECENVCDNVTEDQLCDEWFSKTTSRNSTGKFIVTLPFRNDVLTLRSSSDSTINTETDKSVPSTPSYVSRSHDLTDSYSMAQKRFFNLEHRLTKDPKLYAAYREFMEEYLSLGHMKLATRPGKYYIPHHAVVKENGDVSKIRVVFDASASTSSGASLNDILCVGPKLQTDIFDILLKCRLKKFVFTADIVKMYRQILVSPEDCQYQHILWRKSPADEVQDYELLTVTYGVKSAPYLAIRCLHELDSVEGHKYPKAKNILTEMTYVDDIVAGADSEEELLEVQTDVIGLLRSGACELKKWSSNSSYILKHLPVADCAQHLSFDPKNEHSVKVLGLHWDTNIDVFAYHTNLKNTPRTKRGVLSTIARLFDPIGALGPTILWAKRFMQQLWQAKLNWDDALPIQLHSAWEQFILELPLLRQVSLIRHIDIVDHTDIQLLGFSDASQNGYAAIAYLRVVKKSGDINVYFLACKTKVAPLKCGNMDASLSIPRLELCAALLLAQLLHRLHTLLAREVFISKVHAWTDSTIVLSWLKSNPKDFKIFVTNRIAAIHNLLPNCEWNYVSTSNNPADPSSRGLLPKVMLRCPIHWNGPSFLRCPEQDWPTSSYKVINSQDLPEVKPVNHNILILNETPKPADEMLSRFSSFNKMLRTFAYALRFGRRALRRITAEGPLTQTELHYVLMTAIHLTQMTYFSSLFKQLNHVNSIVTPASLAQLAPFIDSSGIIRVGGRLRFSALSPDAKHPILLPKKSHLTYLLIKHYHLSYLHGGAKLILNMISQKYWILSGRDAVRRHTFACIPCTRVKASHPKPLMGDLPPSRFQSHRAFRDVGMDYGGPFIVKETNRRNSKPTKVYLALFICMSVKAVHLEMVTDLSTEAFLAALDRFVSRRGIPSNLYSDCGTNYVGASRQLKELFDQACNQNTFTSRIPCTWHFNPPAAPHFGGLWEAAIKSTKIHLKRVIGQQTLTSEEFQTLITRIEGILNSRPLTPLSADPNDLCALTPGHFLIGQPLCALPENDMTNITMNKLTRWQLIRQLYQSFWKRWAIEYLSTLQGRSKWYKSTSNIEIGDLVIIDTPQRPPTHWNMGRVIAVHPGKDHIVRVATVKTQNSVFKRAVTKLVKLPVKT